MRQHHTAYSRPSWAATPARLRVGMAPRITAKRKEQIGNRLGGLTGKRYLATDQLAIEGFNFRDTEHGTPMAAGVVKGVQRPVGVAGDHEVIACNRRPRQGLRRKVCDPPDVDP